MDIYTIQGLVIKAFGMVVAALIFWFVGRWFIARGVAILATLLRHKNIDATITQYLLTATNVLLHVLLVIGILGYFGIETTSFVAIFAAAGLAIGMAWSGLLANFAAGVFLLLLRPIKVGDWVAAGGASGEVVEIGIFATILNTDDNVRTIVGNNKITGGNIANFSANTTRRVDIEAQLFATTDVSKALALLKANVEKVANVSGDPGVILEILRFNAVGPVLAVRPSCNNRDYWQVYFDTNRAILHTLSGPDFPRPNVQPPHHATTE